MTVNTSTHPVTIDGVRMDNLAWNILVRKGWDLGLPVRGSDQQVPGRDGEIWTPNKTYGPGRFILSMWVRGTDQDGNPPSHGDDYAQYRQNLDQLHLLFGKRHALLDIQQDLGPAGIRQAFGEVRQAIDPDFPGRTRGQFDVLFQLPYAFWQDTVDQNYDSAAGVALGTLTLPAFAGASAPMKDLYMVWDGPWTNPAAIDVATGHKIQLNAAVPAGQQWVVNTTTRSSKVGSGIEFTDTGTNEITSTVKSGAYAPALFGLTPIFGASPQITIDGSGLGAGSRFRVRGRRKYQ